jgi:hypothetical protein
MNGIAIVYTWSYGSVKCVVTDASITSGIFCRLRGTVMNRLEDKESGISLPAIYISTPKITLQINIKFIK